MLKARPPSLLTDWWRHGLEKSLAGDGFGGLQRAIGHRGDHGAAYHREPESGGENHWTTRGGTIRPAILGARPLRDIERRREGDIEEIEPVQHWCRCRSAYVLNWDRQKCRCWCPDAGIDLKSAVLRVPHPSPRNPGSRVVSRIQMLINFTSHISLTGTNKCDRNRKPGVLLRSFLVVSPARVAP